MTAPEKGLSPVLGCAVVWCVCVCVSLCLHVCLCKCVVEMNKQKSQFILNGVRTPEGGILTSFDSRAQQEEEKLFFLARTQAMRSHRLCLLWPSQLPLSVPYKKSPSLAMWRDLHLACHGCRPHISIVGCNRRGRTLPFWVLLAGLRIKLT